MKQLVKIFFGAVLLTCCACHENFQLPNGGKGVADFSKFSINCEGVIVEVTTKAVTEATDDYIVEILTEDEQSVFSGTYKDVKASGFGVELLAGSYHLRVLSAEVPNAAFEKPVYGASENFTITAGEKTMLDPVTCTLQQCAATVSYSEEIQEMMTGDGCAKVEVLSGYPLEYNVKYSAGGISFETRTGYFAVPSEPTTMVVSFSGRINGKVQTMNKSLTNVNMRELRKIIFVKKEGPEGNVTFDIVVNSYVQDEELSGFVQAQLPDPIGDDPDAPKGDGGIKLEFAPDCTQFTDLNNIEVPSSGKPFDLRLVATVPNSVKKFKVDIASTNKGFEEAVAAAGGPVIDLINPSEESQIIFQVVPFPHGAELIGQTSVDFDLSAAQEPILLFPGEHTFKMMVTDGKGCHNDITVKMIVK